MSSKDKEKWDAVIKKVLFEIRDHVKLTHEGRFGLEPQFKHPFIVMNKNNKYGTYQLKTMEGKPLASWVHVDQLYKTNGDAPNDTWYNPTTSCSAWCAAMRLLDTEILNDAVDSVASPDDVGACGRSQSQEGGNVRVDIGNQNRDLQASMVLILRLSYKCQKRNTRSRLDNLTTNFVQQCVVPDLGWSSFYYNKVKRNSHYTAVNAQEDITAHKEVLRLTIFRFYRFIKIMSDKETKSDARTGNRTRALRVAGEDYTT
ncbi:hypothetical protein PHYBLDRAFT_174667 [Phycomyces blakesleeanus NRRL 1555(-)]|uniref:Uncharacterized protein n=1 Tax=Phycomyces blakesleeanus (strain ATCC 8743b / DSM 1359 / FGSC 10004 / NBRC 33097 / NRRL 1555) TaxID=763407 RepID=A0A167JZ09_PHYB8|nr:hypothetical protein PHYBLDRAFT_174667 [Phycomyces blakesleeanus NRRL 1555(-)]OAD66957.1 hypothetical protein PHYBLDRAFT_174667 [Phycomyces blakesleeanus NRRL 1555(-)]|eukprot:XP_018284997.1 hypothetical protein PHYBLDRAFT_174667 [Phycomyces blakesleeanus NRRL 1555(-)]